MNIGLILESVSINAITQNESVSVKEMFENAVKDDGKVFMEALDNFIEKEMKAIDESDKSIGDKIKAKLKAIVAYIVSAYKYCTSVYKRFIDDVALVSDKYGKYVKENKERIDAGYKKLVMNNAEYEMTKFSKISKENICKIIETKFGDIGIRLDIQSAYVDSKPISDEQKKKLAESVAAFTDKGTSTTKTKKVGDVKLDDVLYTIEHALEDRANLYLMSNYLKIMQGSVEATGEAIHKKGGDEALEIYMTNIKFVAGMVSKSMTQYLNLHVARTGEAYKFVKHCAEAIGKSDK